MTHVGLRRRDALGVFTNNERLARLVRSHAFLLSKKKKKEKGDKLRESCKKR